MIGVDVERYSARNVRQQVDTQRELDRVLSQAAGAVGLERQEWQRQPGGDGELAILPPDVDLVATVSGFVSQLDDLLTAYNEDHSDAMKIRLRVAMHMDMVVLNSVLGYAGPALVVLSRLLDSKEFKHALAETGEASMALLVSESVYHSVVETGLPGLRPGHFRLLTIDNPAKGFKQPAYLYIPGAALKPTAAAAPADPAEPSQADDGSATAGEGGFRTTVISPSVGRNMYVSGRDLYVGHSPEADN